MKTFKIILFLVFFLNPLHASSDYLNEGIVLYNKKEFKKAKFKFEQDIVFNPKSEKSYLYLSKIFHKQENKDLEEKNLNTVILLNPLNEEATFNLAKLKFTQSDYNESKKLIDELSVFCDKFCQKTQTLKIEVEKSFKKK